MRRPFSRVPLAWFNLTHDKRRLVVSVLGVAFAVFLMFVELGFLNAVLDSSVQLIRKLDGQLFLVSKARFALNVKEPFTRRRLEQARAVPGVQSAAPLYLEYGLSDWKNVDPSSPWSRPQSDESGNSHTIRVLAFDPDQPVLDMREVNDRLGDLKIPYNVLLDKKSKKEYGPIEAGITRELAGHAVHVVGLFDLGTDFSSNGTVIMSDETYARLFPAADSDVTLGLVDVGVVRVEEGEDVEKVRAALDEALPDDVTVYTKEQFIRAEQAYWKRSTPVGFVFQLGLWMGFVVGAVICYQIISTDVSDHLAEYATLKAIGYADLYLNSVVLRETLWLSVLGFLPGWALSAALYYLLSRQVGLLMFLNAERVLSILALTVVMCVLSGLFALRKVKSADPAEVF